MNVAMMLLILLTVFGHKHLEKIMGEVKYWLFNSMVWCSVSAYIFANLHYVDNAALSIVLIFIGALGLLNSIVSMLLFMQRTSKSEKEEQDVE